MRAARLALWAGVECTVNRVGDTFRDQVEETGHHTRDEDIDAIAGLGVEAVRYPVVWERAAPTVSAQPDLRWADARLAALHARGVRPIVGLLHHGSGPAGTDLLDPGFPAALAAYARVVAQRYPWVTEWTPVNEPVTTARFSALYGHWYPHGRCTRAFLRALYHECLGTALAMREVRRVVPGAWLVQTEDVGTVFAAPKLRYQADYENERRWLSFDLLTGRVRRGHPLYAHLLEQGLTTAELSRLEALAEEDHLLLGLNYYATSDRYLDPRLERYPRSMHGGNGRHAYVDTEAVRARPEGMAGHRAMLHAASARYGRPVAITEAHLGCTREEQLRWLAEAWDGAEAARADGVDVRAVTVWSLFGAKDWDSLVTQRRGHYEPGAFDARCSPPRPTAVAAFAASLAQGHPRLHPAQHGAGWWRRNHAPLDEGVLARRPRLLRVCSAGVLSRTLAHACARRDLAAEDASWSRAAALLHGDREGASWGVVLGLDASVPPAAVRDIAAAAHHRRLPVLLLSSASVFGSGDDPRGEDDLPPPSSPLALQESAAREGAPGALLVRLGAVLAPEHEGCIVSQALLAIARGEGAIVPAGLASPTYLPDAVDAALDLLIDGAQGTVHLVHGAPLPWTELALLAAEHAGYGAARVEASCSDAPAPLVATGGELLPPLAHALARFVVACAAWPPAAGAA